MVIFLGTFLQLVLMVADTTANVPKDLSRAAATLGANQAQIYRLVLIPGALPGIMDDLRITMAGPGPICGGRLVAADSGLGYMILRAQRFLPSNAFLPG